MNVRPKCKPLRDESYRRLVASLPCAHCGKSGPSQCAHGDEGKGMGKAWLARQRFPLGRFWAGEGGHEVGVRA